MYHQTFNPSSLSENPKKPKSLRIISYKTPRIPSKRKHIFRSKIPVQKGSEIIKKRLNSKPKRFPLERSRGKIKPRSNKKSNPNSEMISKKSYQSMRPCRNNSKKSTKSGRNSKNINKLSSKLERLKNFGNRVVSNKYKSRSKDKHILVKISQKKGPKPRQKLDSANPKTKSTKEQYKNLDEVKFGHPKRKKSTGSGSIYFTRQFSKSIKLYSPICSFVRPAKNPSSTQQNSVNTAVPKQNFYNSSISNHNYTRNIYNHTQVFRETSKRKSPKRNSRKLKRFGFSGLNHQVYQISKSKNKNINQRDLDLLLKLEHKISPKKRQPRPKSKPKTKSVRIKKDYISQNLKVGKTSHSFRFSNNAIQPPKPKHNILNSRKLFRNGSKNRTKLSREKSLTSSFNRQNSGFSRNFEGKKRRRSKKISNSKTISEMGKGDSNFVSDSTLHLNMDSTFFKKKDEKSKKKGSLRQFSQNYKIFRNIKQNQYLTKRNSSQIKNFSSVKKVSQFPNLKYYFKILCCYFPIYLSKLWKIVLKSSHLTLFNIDSKSPLN